MKTKHQPWTLFALAILLPAAAGQAPLLHYAFSEGGSPATTDNIGTHSPGPSPLIGHTLTGTSQNRTNALTGVTGAANEVTTPYNVALGTGSWTIGFALNSTASPAFQYIFSEGVANTGWRAFTDGGAGVGNLRMTAPSFPSIDVVGGAGESGWVHVAFVHDTVANVIRAYLNGVLVSTTAAASTNLASGSALIIGRASATGLLTGNLVDEFRLYDYALTASQVASWSDNALTGAADLRKVMISEVSWGDPDGLEITNFSTSTVNLATWRVMWRDGNGTITSDPLALSIAAGESVVVMESVSVPEGVPTGTQVVDRFTNIPTTSSGFTVALLDGIGNALDEVRVSDSAGAPSPWSFGSAFRGSAVRGVVSGLSGQVGVERIWGLDSDCGADWTDQPNRSLGRENRSSGPRGTDPQALLGIKINEIDDNADYIELFNPNGINVGVAGWFFVMSAGQGGTHTIATIPAGTVVSAGSYAVFGDTATAPAELPGGIPYVILAAIPWVSSELDCALYDNLGRLVDLVRAPQANTTLIHNFPRAPSHWADFVGAAARNLNGSEDAIGRSAASADTNDGGDWFPIFTRTMGSVNNANTQAGPAGHDDAFDVRLNETSLGQGFQAIMNAGSGAAGNTFNFLVSLGHNNGAGPFFGLGADALANIPSFYNVPPFSGLLDAEGSARIDFPPGTLPSGIDADFIFVLQAPGGAVTALTYVLEYDT